MNQKQFITMWCGIAAIVLAGLTVIENYGLVCSYGFLVWVFIVALVTGGLIYSFKDGSGRKMKNVIQDIRGNILRKKQSRMKTDDYDKDKHLIHSENQIP
jgi:nitrate reductase NapE component